MINSLARPGGREADMPTFTETVEPSDERAVADAVQRASNDGTAVYPVGGGTRLGLGARPSEPGMKISLRQLNRVIDYPSRDLTITVEAGAVVADVQRLLATQGQRLPIDVPLPSIATVGGIVAGGAAGPRQFRWGTIRDYVIGLRVIDGTGTAFAAGGRVVKNAAGYDLCRLFTGSNGVLGVIVQITLMVKPVPEDSAFAIAEVPDCESAERVLAGLTRTRVLPSAIELLAGPEWRMPGDFSDSASALRIVVGFEGTAEEVSWMLDQLQTEWRQAEIASIQTAVGEDARMLWQRLADFPARIAPPDGEEGLVVQFHVLPSAACELVKRLLSENPDASIQAHAGNGVVVARFQAADDEAAALVEQRLRPAAIAAGGHAIVLARPRGSEMSASVVFGPPPPGFAVMQAIKRQFDPKGILNRGRFLLG